HRLLGSRTRRLRIARGARRRRHRCRRPGLGRASGRGGGAQAGSGAYARCAATALSAQARRLQSAQGSRGAAGIAAQSIRQDTETRVARGDRLGHEGLMTARSIKVYSDYKSPYAYLAKDLAYDLERETGVTLEWLPYTLDIPAYLGN